MSRRFATAPAPHVPPPTSVGAVMRTVLYALAPAIAAHAWFFGPGIVVQVVLASAFAVAIEAAMLRLRGQPLGPFLGDGSAVLTAVLFALCLPSLAPWWISAVGMLFAIALAKHLYGGLGHNTFNPAMVGYVAVLVSFPLEMTQWLPPRGLADPPGLGASLAAILFGQPPAAGWDAVTQATPLDLVKHGVDQGRMVSEVREGPLFGDFGATGWEWIANAYAAGGLFLLWRRIITWHAPLAMIATVAVIGGVAWLIDPGSNPGPLQQVFSGAVMIGAFFIATDPVSGCVSPRGRLLFGVGVGLVTLLIRRWGGYPDGVAFGILLMNMAAPLIDRYTRPRVFGR